MGPRVRRSTHESAHTRAPTRAPMESTHEGSFPCSCSCRHPSTRSSLSPLHLHTGPTPPHTAPFKQGPPVGTHKHMYWKTREGCGCFRGLFGASRANSEKVPAKFLEIFPNREMLQILWISDTGKGKPGVFPSVGTLTAKALGAQLTIELTKALAIYRIQKNPELQNKGETLAKQGNGQILEKG